MYVVPIETDERLPHVPFSTSLLARLSWAAQWRQALRQSRSCPRW